MVHAERFGARKRRGTTARRIARESDFHTSSEPSMPLDAALKRAGRSRRWRRNRADRPMENGPRSRQTWRTKMDSVKNEMTKRQLQCFEVFVIDGVRSKRALLELCDGGLGRRAGHGRRMAQPPCRMGSTSSSWRRWKAPPSTKSSTSLSARSRGRARDAGGLPLRT